MYFTAHLFSSYCELYYPGIMLHVYYYFCVCVCVCRTVLPGVCVYVNSNASCGHGTHPRWNSS